MKSHATALPVAAPAVAPALDAWPTPHAGARLWLALLFPTLPLLAFGPARADSPPWAVSVRHGRRERLLGVDPRARAAGVREGMDVTAATLVCPTLHVRRHDPVHEAAALDGLAARCGLYTSMVSLEPPRGLLLEIGASLRLFGGLGPLLERVRRDLRTSGHVAIEGIAPTPTAAWLLARADTRAPVTVASRLAGSLSRVPVACMDLPAGVVSDLMALGVHTFGDCARLPRDGLVRRFGPDLVAFLDRALGRRADPRSWWQPPPCFERRLDLAFHSADRGVLLHAVRCLLDELCGFLCTRACAAGALELQLAHHAAPATRLVLELVSPSRDAGHLLALVAERIERLSIEREVLHVGLRVERLMALAPCNGDLYARSVSAADADDAGQGGERLVERLGARLGREAVRALVRRADHRPEHASAEPAWHRRGAASRDTGPAPETGMPLWLLPRPRPLEGGGAAMVGVALGIEQGPWRIESGWWDGRDAARDYYVARSAHGTRYWVFRERREPRRWFLQGIFA